MYCINNCISTSTLYQNLISHRRWWRSVYVSLVPFKWITYFCCCCLKYIFMNKVNIIWCHVSSKLPKKKVSRCHPHNVTSCTLLHRLYDVVAQTCSWLCKHITYIRRLPIRFWFLFLDTKQTLLCHRSWLTNELRNSSFTIRHKQSYNKGMHWCAHAHMHTNFNHTWFCYHNLEQHFKKFTTNTVIYISLNQLGIVTRMP